MAGRFGAVILAAGVLTSGLARLGATDAETPTPTPASSPAASPTSGVAPPNREENRGGRGAGEPQHMRNFHQFIDQLPGPQRARFQQNLDMWNTLTSEERKNLSVRYEERRKRIKNEIDSAIKQVGLNLDEPTRKAFADQYMKERAKIEQTLRQEMDVKRRTMATELLERLKTEFAAKSLPAAMPTPGESAIAPPLPALSPSPAPSATAPTP